MQFANPALLFGALLFAVPLIIHLLNRRRHRVRRWAAMEFLLRAYQKQRKRLRRENLLLLLLRCLIPILLALAIARPTLRGDAPLGGSSDGGAHHVFVFDASYSMGTSVSGAVTPFERSKQLATLLLDGIQRRVGEKITIVLASLRTSMPLREDLNVARAKERIAALGGPTDSATELTDALSQVADLVEESTTDTRVYLFTDLQVRAFGSDPFESTDDAPRSPPEPTDGISEEMFEDTAVDAVRRIQEKASLTVIDTHGAVPGEPENLQVTSIDLDAPHAIAKAPVALRAKILNRSSTQRVVQATLEIDGAQPQRVTAEIDAGAEREVTFYETFRELGQRRIEISLGEDDLAADNSRFRVISVRDRIRVLVVEGSGEDELELRESTHLSRILDPSGGETDATLSPFELTHVGSIPFLSGRTRLDEFDVIVLANVAHMNEVAARALTRAIEAGSGALIMLGANADYDSYNLHLHRAGDGPSPLLLLDAAGFAPGGERYFGAEIRTPSHPVFGDFPEESFFQIFEALPVFRFVRSEFVTPTEAEAAPDRDVLVAVRDEDRSPLLAVRSYGQGRSAVLTSSISRRFDRWNGLDFEVTAFPFLHRLAHWLATPSVDEFNVTVGGSLTATTPGRPADLAIVLPERAGASKVLIGDEPQPLVGGRYALPPFTRTEFAGFYELEMAQDVGGSQERSSRTFAVNPEIEEGDLRYYSHAAAREHLGFESIVTDLPSDSEAAIQAGLNDLGKLFLWLTIAAVIGEAILARFVARRRA